ncbi:MAG: S8 family serine peptidase [Traorella sp.]
MKLKRLLVVALTVSMLVTSVFSNLGTKVYANADTTTTTQVQETTKGENELKNNDDFTSESGIIRGEDALDESETTSPSNNETSATKPGYTLEEVDGSEINVDLTNQKETNSIEKVDENEFVNVIILLNDKAVVEDNQDATLNFFTKLKIAYLEYKQNSVINKIEKKVLDGETLEVHYQYTWLLNGIAAKIPYGLIDEVEAIRGVKDVLLQPVYELDKEVDPNTVSDGVMIGREDTWASGYTGEGMKIAIIDTGIDDDHQNFQAMDESKLTEDSTTLETIDSVLTQLHSYELYNGLTAEKLYRSNKIAYGFNYVDRSLVINHDRDTEGDHGTHVAGIAAANDLGNGEAFGTAPDAQLYVMKVFGYNGGAYAEDYLAAIEDALLLGADVINLSLGSPAGFTTDGAYVDAIFESIADTGTVVTISAGNSTTSGQGNLWGTNTNFASNPDNGIVGSPGTYTNILTVASNENVAIYGPYVETAGLKYSYIDGANGANELFATLAGEEFEFVFVDNYGQSAEDFGDLTGKVALIQRGVTSFSSKCDLAAEAGAVAALIFNNTTGTINMDLSGCESTIPCASITMEAGEYMLQALSEGNNIVFISKENAAVSNPDAYKMSEFSSWGATSDLTIGVDITGPGGNIYSTLDNGTYGLMSGTSMSAPNVAGLSALVKEYVKETYPQMSNSEVRVLVTSLLMSTATPLEYSDGLTYSPRQQGSGLANAYNAIKALAYLSVDGMDAPKVELKDDPDRKGSYEYTFKVTNLSDLVNYYAINTSVQTEQYEEIEDYLFMGTTPVALSALTDATSSALLYNLDYDANDIVDVRDAHYLYDLVLADTLFDTREFFRYDLDSDEDADTADVQLYLDMLVEKDVDVDKDAQILKVDANSSVEVQVNVDVTAEGKEYMDTYFENGIYVEGFTVLTGLSSETLDLSLPYMAFYGDWTEAPILDSGYYYDDTFYDSYYYYHVLYTQYDGDDYGWFPGLNPYVEEESGNAYISFSPNGDGYADYITDIYVSLVRNAKDLTFTYTDENGNVVFEDTIEHVSKTYYVDAYGICVPYVYSWYSDAYDLTDEEGNVFANNTKLTLTVKATLDYDVHESNNESDTWTIPFTVDLEAPKILDWEIVVDEENEKQYLDLKFADNVATAAVNFVASNGLRVLDQVGVDHETEGKEYVRYDITGFGNKFYVVLGDYALNESYYYFKTTDNLPVLDTDLLYGYRVFDTSEDYYTNDMEYGWIGIGKDDASVEIETSEWYMDYALVAAEYVGGYIVGVEAYTKDLVYMVPGDWDNRVKIATLGFEVRDLAFDPTTGYLYGYTTKDADGAAAYQLVQIDLSTGEYELLGYKYAMYSYVAALACDDEGVLYGIDSNGKLKVINKTSGTWDYTTLLDTKEVTGFTPKYSQSMTYDADENALYWAAFFSEDLYDDNYNYLGTEYHGDLYRIDLETYEMVCVGTIGGDAEVIGLLKLDDRGYQLPSDVELSEVSIKESTVAMLIDNEVELTVVISPWYGSYDSIKWSVDDESVATVEDGVIKAVGAGKTTVHLYIDDLEAECSVKVLNPQADLSGFAMSGNTLYNQWIDFNTDLEYETLTDGDFLTFYAGEYVNGTIYAYASNGAFYAIDAETKEYTRISSPRSDILMYDMAYDYSTGYLYGIMLDMAYGYEFVAIDPLTGAIQVINYDLYDEQYNPPVGLSVSLDGTIYMVTQTGFLCEYDIEENYLTSLGFIGYTPSSLTQSLVYDYNDSENPGIYWTMISSSYELALTYIDIETATALPLGAIDGGSQICALYMVPENVPELDLVEVDKVNLTSNSITLLEGATSLMPVEILPYNATNRTINWKVEDESVASVDGLVVTGLSVGETSAYGTISTSTGVVNFEVSIQVLESAGELSGYILTDYGTYDGYFWGQFKDYDLSSGNGLGYTDYALYAGEYYDGYVYGYGEDSFTYEHVFIKVDMETLESEIINGDFADVRDMAFDYSEGVMYAVAGSRNVVEGSTSIYAVDINTGDLYFIAEFEVSMFTLACSTDGQLYGVDDYGTFYAINKITGELTEIGDTGKYPNQYQSMAYDHNTGNLYWAYACYDYFSGAESGLYIVNTEDASLVNLGIIGTGGSQVTALHTVPENVTVGTPTIRGLQLKSTNIVLEVEDTYQLKATLLPVSVNQPASEFTYKIADESIATVDTNGNITALKAGTTTVEVTTNGVSVSATIHVVDETTKLYAMSSNGWDITPLFDPSTIDASYSNPDDLSVEMATYNNGYFYGIDEEGYLWKYNEDSAVMIGEQPVYETFSNINSYRSGVKVVDLSFNPVTNALYALGELESYGSSVYCIYEVALTGENAGQATWAGSIYSYDIGRPIKFEFVSETKMVIYDGFMDYLYTAELPEEPEALTVKQVLWVQNVLASGDYLGMTYSKELDLLFIASTNLAWEASGDIDLFKVDLNANTIEKVGTYADNPYFIDLVMVEDGE